MSLDLKWPGNVKVLDADFELNDVEKSMWSMRLILTETKSQEKIWLESSRLKLGKNHVRTRVDVRSHCEATSDECVGSFFAFGHCWDWKSALSLAQTKSRAKRSKVRYEISYVDQLKMLQLLAISWWFGVSPDSQARRNLRFSLACFCRWGYRVLIGMVGVAQMETPFTWNRFNG